MTQPSIQLRQAVFKALSCAQAAAQTQRFITDLGVFTSDHAGQEDLKRLMEAAYAASAHAWMAMIAMVGNNVEVAQSAAQAAQNACDDIRLICRSAFSLDLPINDRPIHSPTPPDTQDLIAFWNNFCQSLPESFPAPDNLDHSLSIVDTEPSMRRQNQP